MGRSRFLLPAVFSVAGIASTIAALYWITKDFPYLSFISYIPGTLYTDILILLVAAMPIIAIEYFIIGIPMAALYLFTSKIIKAASFDTDIMHIGSSFGGFRILRRAAAPALFSVSTAGLVSGVLRNYLFEIPTSIAPALRPLYPISITLMGALIVMPVALALFVPTWILNDAGIVTHLKKGQMDVRQCPDTEGVGKWYSNMLRGYSILAFPITMFIEHFFNVFVIGGSELVTPGVPLWASPIFVSFLCTAGIPLLVMSFITPAVLLNEAAQDRTGRIIKRIAMRLGASEIHRPIISRVQPDLPSEEETPG
jgi:hypothetical protein